MKESHIKEELTKKITGAVMEVPVLKDEIKRLFCNPISPPCLRASVVKF